MFTVIPVTPPNVLSGKGVAGTEILPETVMLWALLLPAFLIPFTAFPHVAESDTDHKVGLTSPPDEPAASVVTDQPALGAPAL